MKIGIPIDDLDPHAGGGYSYTHQLINSIDDFEFDDQLEIIFIDMSGKSSLNTKKKLLSFHPYKNPTITDLFRKVYMLGLQKINVGWSNRWLEAKEVHHSKRRDVLITQELKLNQIDLLFYLRPGGNDFDYPFITTHWDIGHYSTYMFPEFVEAFESRKHFYETVLPKALAVITETEMGKKELMQYTKLNSDRIKVMPLFPGKIINENATLTEQVSILEKYALEKNKFLLYPAQFWAHKNHMLLLEAFDEVGKTHPLLKLVFTGADRGNLAYIQNQISAKNLEEKVHILGFIPNTELFSLYKNAAALVMPTFLGPSNMPPLEAAYLGCPVLLSDLEGHRELMGDYATYFNPVKVGELTTAILTQLSVPRTEKNFENSGHFSTGNAMKNLQKALLSISHVRKTWN